jgi:transcriptional regulator with XRE-family HTH domain
MTKRNLTQQNLSKRLKINQSLVSRFCTGDRLPSLPVFLRLIAILKKNERSQFIKILNEQLEVEQCKNYLNIQ